MSRRVAIPLAAGLAAAALAFAVALLATGGDGRTATATATAAAPSRGRAVFARMGCGSCHTLAAAGSRGQIGPPLDAALADHTRASLRAKIARPGAGSVMPQDFAQRMSASDLTALVDFLMAARRAS